MTSLLSKQDGKHQSKVPVKELQEEMLRDNLKLLKDCEENLVTINNLKQERVKLEENIVALEESLESKLAKEKTQQDELNKIK
jgi:hypothetical protein